MSLRVAASRRLSRVLGHGDRMWCSYLHLYARPEERWVDALFFVLRGERRHCARCAAWEAMVEAEAQQEALLCPRRDPVHIYRLAGIM